MTKFQLNRADAPWDYPSLGFRADTGTAILDGSLSTPAITVPPDAYWSVYVGGSAETGITRYADPVGPDPATENTDGSTLIYSDEANRFIPATPEEFFSNTAVADVLSATIDAQVPAASTSAQGKVELATTAEATTGTDTARAVTPAGVKAAATDTAGAIVAFNDDRYATHGPTLPTPGDGQVVYAGHRFGSGTVPEHTIEGARAAVSSGVKALEMDVAAAKDSSGPLFHDPTVDRTTTATGNVNTYTAADFAAMSVDAATWFNAKWPNTRVVYFDDIAREFGNRVLLIPESKVGARAGLAIADAVDRYGLHDSVLICAFQDSLLAGVLGRTDLNIAYINPNGDADFAAKAAQGYTDILFDYDNPANAAATIAAINAAGMRAGCYTVNRRHEAATLIAAGAQLIITDYPIYLDSTLDTRRRMTTDPFASQSPYPGMLSSNTGDASFTAPDRLYLGALGGKQFFLQGWACPIDKTAADTYTLTQTFTVETLGTATTQWAGIWFGAADDRAYTDAGASDENGYLILMRMSTGQIILYRRVNGTATQLGTVTTSALVLSSTATLTVQVTPTQIIVTRTDTGNPAHTFTATDATHRGKYFHYGKSADSTGLRLSVKDVTIA